MLVRLARTYDVGILRLVPALRFTWDPQKSATNKRKHGVTFDEARTVFADDHGLLIDDPDHSDEEDRFILLGMSSTARVLVVCHCYRGDDDVIRIISARRASSSERATYTERVSP